MSGANIARRKHEYAKNVQRWREERQMERIDAGEITERAGDVYIEIAQAAVERIWEVKKQTLDIADQQSKKYLYEQACREQKWQRRVEARSFDTMNNWVDCAWLIKKTIETLHGELEVSGYMFDFLVEWYPKSVLHGNKLEPKTQNEELCDVLYYPEDQFAVVMAVMEQMHSLWTKRNVSLISDIRHKHIWHRFMNFYLAGEQVMHDYAIILMPILKDLGVNETHFANWRHTYDALAEQTRRYNCLKNAEALQSRLEYSGAGVFGGLPDSVRQSVRRAIQSDNGERASAMAAGAFAKW